MKGEFERISHGGKVLKDTTAVNAEREALRLGVEYLMSLFPVEAMDFQFAVENESRETKYKVETQSMRLFGLRNDCAEDVHRADANRLDKKKCGARRGGKHAFGTLTEGKCVSGGVIAMFLDGGLLVQATWPSCSPSPLLSSSSWC